MVGLPQFDGWSQVVERQGDWGLFILSFSVQGQHAGNIGRDVVTLLEEKPATSPRVFHQRLQEIITHVQFNGAQIHLAAGLLLKNSTLLAVDSGLIFLKRGKRMGIVVESEAGLKLVEGNYQAEDIFLFITQPAREFLPEIKLKFEQGYDVPTTVTSIVPSVHQSEITAISSIGVVYEEVEDEHRVFEPKRQIAHRFVTSSNLPSMQVDTSAVELNSTTPVNLTTEKDHKIKLVGSAMGCFSHLVWRLIQGLVKLLVRGLCQVWRLLKLTTDRHQLRIESSRDRIKRLVTMIVLAILLIGLIWLGWSWRSRRQIKASTTGQLAPIIAQLESTRSMAGADPITARRQVEEVQQQLQVLFDQTQSSVAQEIIGQTQIQASHLFEEISGYEKINALDQFYDLRLASLDFVTSRSAGNDLQAVFLDAQKQQLLVLSLVNKSVEKYDLLELESAREVAFVENKVVLLADGFLSLEKGDSEENATWQTMIDKSDTNQAGTFLRSFGSNIYIFAPEKRNIYRYLQDKAGDYSAPVGWLISPLGVPFDDITSMAVDGDIWLTTKDGQIKRFTYGKAQEFSPSDLNQPFVGPLTIVTSQELQALYILEPINNRVVVLTKDGQFLKEVKSSSLGTATTILVSQELQKILAVSGSIIYEIGL